MSDPNSAEHPWPVRTVARHIGDWVDRLGRVWVEGQVTELRRAPGRRVWLVLRDPVAAVSLRIGCPPEVAAAPALAEGARVVVWAKPSFYLANGSLSLTAFEIRPVGIGALLERLERLRATLAAEGLFAPQRKRGLPFLPRRVGLVCGRGSAAERDVRENAARRWPAVRFVTREVAVQGPYAVGEVIDALAELGRHPEVDVVVLARGGGSVEDLLPFSDEALCRAVAACPVPVVSAIGHEQDTPLVDHVADVRASTPTDAGKLVVPDLSEQIALVTSLLTRGRRCLRARLEAESARLAALRSRPVLATPGRELDRRADAVDELRRRARRCATAALAAASAELEHVRARVAALSPGATLARGYAVVQRGDGVVVRSPADSPPGTRLRLRLAAGELAADAVAAAEPSGAARTGRPAERVRA